MEIEIFQWYHGLILNIINIVSDHTSTHGFFIPTFLYIGLQQCTLIGSFDFNRFTVIYDFKMNGFITQQEIQRTGCFLHGIFTISEPIGFRISFTVCCQYIYFFTISIINGKLRTLQSIAF